MQIYTTVTLYKNTIIPVVFLHNQQIHTSSAKMLKLFKSVNMDIMNVCLLHFKFSLLSELIQERKEKFVSKLSQSASSIWN